MKQISMHLPKGLLRDLDFLVGIEMYPSRGEAVRMAVRDLLLSELWLKKETT